MANNSIPLYAGGCYCPGTRIVSKKRKWRSKKFGEIVSSYRYRSWTKRARYLSTDMGWSGIPSFLFSSHDYWKIRLLKEDDEAVNIHSLAYSISCQNLDRWGLIVLRRHSIRLATWLFNIFFQFYSYCFYSLGTGNCLIFTIMVWLKVFERSLKGTPGREDRAIYLWLSEWGGSS